MCWQWQAQQIRFSVSHFYFCVYLSDSCTVTSECTSSASSAPVYWQRPRCLCEKSRREEREEPGEAGVGRRGEGVGGTRSRTQEVEKDEEPGDNVMHRGAEPGGRGGEEKASSGERRQRKNVGRGGEQATEGEHRVCASGTRRQGKIAWARLAGRVCLCLIEEGCETQTPHWLSCTGMLPLRDGPGHTQASDTCTQGRERETEEWWGWLQRRASFLKAPKQTVTCCEASLYKRMLCKHTELCLNSREDVFEDGKSCVYGRIDESILKYAHNGHLKKTLKLLNRSVSLNISSNWDAIWRVKSILS